MRILLIALCAFLVISPAHAQKRILEPFSDEAFDYEYGGVLEDYRISKEREANPAPLSQHTQDLIKQHEANKIQGDYDNAPERLESTYKSLGFIREVYRVTPDGFISDTAMEQAEAIAADLMAVYTKHNPDMNAEEFKERGLATGAEMATAKLASYSDRTMEERLRRLGSQVKMYKNMNKRDHDHYYRAQ